MIIIRGEGALKGLGVEQGDVNLNNCVGKVDFEKG